MGLRDMIAADSILLARELGESVMYAPKGSKAPPGRSLSS